jgi:hypothetical protein
VLERGELALQRDLVGAGVAGVERHVVRRPAQLRRVLGQRVGVRHHQRGADRPGARVDAVAGVHGLRGEAERLGVVLVRSDGVRSHGGHPRPSRGFASPGPHHRPRRERRVLRRPPHQARPRRGGRPRRRRRSPPPTSTARRRPRRPRAPMRCRCRSSAATSRGTAAGCPVGPRRRRAS